MRASRDELRSFWLLVREGAGWESAAEALGRVGSTGWHWAQEAGGVCPDYVVHPPRGRYLSLDERIQILVGIKLGSSIREIAQGLGRSPSTVLREIRKNMRQAYRTRGLRRLHGRFAPRLGVYAGVKPAQRAPDWCYQPARAHRRAQERAIVAARSRPTRLATNPRLHERVQELLVEEYSPEQAAAQLRLEFPDDPEMWVSHETIYKALYVQGRGELRRDLHRRLRTGRAMRKPRRKAGERRGRIPGMVNISERSPEVADRAVPGHWEGDLIMGSSASNSAIGTLVERASRFVMLLHLPHGHGADAVQEAMVVAMASLPETLRRTLTWDQGKEMANHVQIAAATGLEIYFCDPHSPWQRGSNENTNGLLRQYLPKGTDLSVYAPDYLDHVAMKLNRRIRKTLDWKTPAQRLDELLSNPPDPTGVASVA
jgi:IS30 family transposase